MGLYAICLSINSAEEQNSKGALTAVITAQSFMVQDHCVDRSVYSRMVTQGEFDELERADLYLDDTLPHVQRILHQDEQEEVSHTQGFMRPAQLR